MSNIDSSSPLKWLDSMFLASTPELVTITIYHKEVYDHMDHPADPTDDEEAFPSEWQDISRVQRQQGRSNRPAKGASIHDVHVETPQSCVYSIYVIWSL